MRTLTELANEEGTDKGTERGAAHGYTRLYERHLAHVREKKIRLLEVGIYRGDSHRMWRRYFPNAEIFGIDNESQEKIPEMPAVRCWSGNQAAEGFVKRFLAESGGHFDVVIDDGGHKADETVRTFQLLFPAVKPGGMYVIEDLHCSYHPEWGGGYMKAGTPIEMVKRMVDGLHHRLHGWRCGGGTNVDLHGLTFSVPEYEPSYADLHVAGLHVYEKIAFIEKGDA